MPKFKKLAKVYEDNALKALQEFVRKESTFDSKTITTGAPFGEGVKSALDYIGQLATTYGFKVDYCDGYATEISYGEEGPLIGIYAHSDVVPATGKWSKPPFEGEVVGEGKNRKMIGRGTSDDKGPLIASLYALKLLKDNDLIKGYRVRLVSGGDEERGSSCLEYYFHKLHKEDATYGFTPDADFPLIYSEKGISRSTLSKTVDLSPIVAIDGGVVSNQVCDKVVLTLPFDKEYKKHFEDNKIEGNISAAGKIMVVTFKGVSAHGSTPEKGKNAIGIAFKDLGEFYKNEFLVNMSKIIDDYNGHSFGGFVDSKDLGLTTYNYGIIKYNNGKLSLSLDFRYGADVTESSKYLENLAKASSMDVKLESTSPSLLFDKKSPLVSTLMKSYKRMTHRFFDKPIAIGGGTYAKEAKNTVAYGSAMNYKGHDGSIHSVDEYIYVDDLFEQIAIYADAIYSLGNLK